MIGSTRASHRAQQPFGCILVQRNVPVLLLAALRTQAR
jgi:hypothetical protein